MVMIVPATSGAEPVVDRSRSVCPSQDRWPAPRREPQGKSVSGFLPANRPRQKASTACHFVHTKGEERDFEADAIEF